MGNVRKTIVASLAALTLGLGVVATTTPADAYYRHGGYGGHYWHGGGWGPGIGLGIVGGLAAGALVGCGVYGCGGYGPGYGYYGDGCVRYRPMYDQWGNYLGRRPVNVC